MSSKAKPRPSRHRQYSTARIPYTRAEVEAGCRDYTDEQRELLLWLHAHALAVYRGCWADVEQLVDMRAENIGKIWRGVYEADVSSVCERIRLAKIAADQRAGSEWVETVTARAMFDVYDRTFERGCMGLIIGESGRGKTYVAEQYQRTHNHGQTYLVRPVRGTEKSVVCALCEATGVADTSRSIDELVGRLGGQLSRKNLIIIDEAQKLLPPGGRNTSALEIVRSVHDVLRTPIVLVVTHQFEDDRTAKRLRRYLRQFNRRMKVRLEIPLAVSCQEASELAAAFNPAPDDLLTARVLELANDADMGAVDYALEMLRDARLIASAVGSDVVELAHLEDAVEDAAVRANPIPEE